MLLSLTLFTILIKQQWMLSLQSAQVATKNEAAIKTPLEKDVQNLNKTKTLNSLDLSNQNLDKLPASVLSKTNLEELDISNNNITGALPAEIKNLQNLKILTASNNKMTGVPAEVGQLSKLEILDLSNNQLTGLPYELGNLKNLKTLNLSGNNYSKQDLETIKKGLAESVDIIL